VAIGQPGAARELAARPPASAVLLSWPAGWPRQSCCGKECNVPLSYLERRAYLGAIRDALAGVEAARVVLVRQACSGLFLPRETASAR
jgi:hypothetical protein